MAAVEYSHHIDASLYHLLDKVNPTLEYTAPCAAFGDQEFVPISLPGGDGDHEVLINLVRKDVDSHSVSVAWLLLARGIIDYGVGEGLSSF